MNGPVNRGITNAISRIPIAEDAIAITLLTTWKEARGCGRERSLISHAATKEIDSLKKREVSLDIAATKV